MATAAAAAAEWKRASGKTITPPSSLPATSSRIARPLMPLRRCNDGRGLGSSAGRGPAFCGVGAVASGTGIGGNPGGGGSRRLASALVSSGADSDEISRDFAAVKDGTETYLVAARELEAGRVIFDRVGGSLSDKRTRHSVQVGQELHMEAEGDLIFLNHSCDPNCQLEVVEPMLVTTARERVRIVFHHAG